MTRRATDYQPHTVLNPRQVGRLLGCTEKHARIMMADGKPPSTKFGRDWVTTYARVVEYLEQCIAGEQPKRTKPAALPAGMPNVQAVIVKPAPARSTRRSSKPRLTPEAVAALALQHNITPEVSPA